ncbi:helix-turn-helix domain-containing protein [Streptomyces sp. NPDC048551]|uniref:heat shock protein transcriptional repressor HspR n=1 Tax=Streptomyces sp. NPDC048551 TaxID=3155758 RepID=UPI00342F7EC2
MDGRRPQTRFGSGAYQLTDETPVYVISVAAQLSGLHPQTLRQYDRLGLVSPDRTAGRGRRYSARDIELLRTVQALSQDEGINLAGIKRIIELENQVAALQQRVAELASAVDGAAATLNPPHHRAVEGDGGLLPAGGMSGPVSGPTG